jgi:hypothetical protein
VSFDVGSVQRSDGAEDQATAAATDPGDDRAVGVTLDKELRFNVHLADIAG